MPHAKRILVTGGAGFIGSAFIRCYLPLCEKIVNLDALTYAGDKARLEGCENPRYCFIQGDICDEALVKHICLEENIDTIVHFAAESHVDRSISSPKLFLQTNVMGTCTLLEVVRQHPHIHFHHVSTDEVYGSLRKNGFFDEGSPYRPNSPYAASKAASDHFVRAYVKTYGICATISHCSNNYGPFQHVEKFVPKIIDNCLKKEPLTIYGDGTNIRDWLYVDDHAEALWLILQKGKPGQVYDIGGNCEIKNIDILHLVIAELSKVTKENYEQLITYVADRPGHDFRYAINSSKIKKQLGWSPRHSIIEGLAKTIHWTLYSHPAMI